MGTHIYFGGVEKFFQISKMPSVRLLLQTAFLAGSFLELLIFGREIFGKEKIATGVLMAKWDFGTKWTVKPLVVL